MRSDAAAKQATSAGVSPVVVVVVQGIGAALSAKQAGGDGGVPLSGPSRKKDAPPPHTHVY